MRSRSEQHAALTSALTKLEVCMRELGLWQEQAPSPSALASVQPFAVDTLTFEQWLQFVFIPKMRQLLAANQPLPGNCAVAPMAEESVKGLGMRAEPLIETLRRIDRLLSQ